MLFLLFVILNVCALVYADSSSDLYHNLANNRVQWFTIEREWGSAGWITVWQWVTGQGWVHPPDPIKLYRKPRFGSGPGSSRRLLRGLTASRSDNSRRCDHTVFSTSNLRCDITIHINCSSYPFKTPVTVGKYLRPSVGLQAVKRTYSVVRNTNFDHSEVIGESGPGHHPMFPFLFLTKSSMYELPRWWIILQLSIEADIEKTSLRFALTAILRIWKYSVYEPIRPGLKSHWIRDRGNPPNLKNKKKIHHAPSKN